MATISKIEIEGFKAFPKYFSLEFGGKNLLMYGENGSGKSSIYYALHVILQSVFKDDKGAKYFKVDEDSPSGKVSISNPEHLINLNRVKDIKSGFQPYIMITLDNGDEWHIDRDGVKSANEADYSDVWMMNKNAVFINHSYISRFHAARNSEGINLWHVFYKDILPFYLPSKRNYFLATKYDEIFEQSKLKPRIKDKNFSKKISDFNDDLYSLINGANKKISSIYNENFKDLDDNDLEITLCYYSDDANENDKHYPYYLFYGNNRFSEKVEKKLYEPQIGIQIKENGQEIYKPQTYFNEAKLTAIALSVRFACLPQTVEDGAFMALDDMLISLDMSNRMKVICYLLNEAIKDYKLYVFTHDRLFYHTFKRIIETQYDCTKWLFGGLYLNDWEDPTSPDFKPEAKNKIDDIHEAYSRHDYFRCGTLLRQLCERCLKELLPESLRKEEDSTTKNLDRQILSLEDFCTHEGVDFTPFKNLKSYKDLFLNSTAHNDITSPFYRNEIKACMKSLEELNKINRSKAIECNKDLSFQITIPGGSVHTIRLRIREEKLLLLEYGSIKRISYYSKCEILKDISEAGEIQINEGFESLYEAYKTICEKYGIGASNDLMDVLRDRKGLIRDKLK